MGEAALGFAGLWARALKAYVGHPSLGARPQGHALSRLARVIVTPLVPFCTVSFLNAALRHDTTPF